MTWNTQRVANILAGLSFLAVLANFYCDNSRYNDQVGRQNTLDSLQQIINSQTFRPQLQLSSTPTIDLAVLKSSGKVITPINPNNLPPPGSTIDVEYDLSIRMNLVVSNVGNHLAAVVAFICMDTMSFSPRLRDVILNRELDTSRSKTKLNPYLLEVSAKDTTTITFEADLNFVKNEADTLHCLILYQNEFGNLFDTYIWVPLSVGRVYYDFIPIPGTDSVKVVRTPGDVRKMIRVSGKPIESFQTYTPFNSKNIKTYLSSIVM